MSGITIQDHAEIAQEALEEDIGLGKMRYPL